MENRSKSCINQWDNLGNIICDLPAGVMLQIIFLPLDLVIIVFCHLQVFIIIMIGESFIGSVVLVLFFF